MSQTVTVIINPKTGETTYEVNGVQGSSCTEITSALIQSNQQKDQAFTHELEAPELLPDYITEGN